MIDPAAEVRKAIGESEFLRGLEEAKALLGGGRKLKAEEVRKLKKAGNWASDWKKLRTARGKLDPDRIRNCRFFGEVRLGSFKGEVKLGGLSHPAGVYGSTLSDCVVCDEALVKDVGLISHVVVREKAVVASCGQVSCPGGCTFGNGSELPVAIETGGREVLTYAELTIPVAELIARNRAEEDMLAAYAEAVGEYLERAKSEFMVVSEGAVVSNTPAVKGVFVGAHARIDGATLVENSTILSNEEEGAELVSGAYVSGAILQWGCEVATMAIVKNSVMTEHSHVERHGKLTDSIAGPNTGVAEGEVTASLLGPFVGFHHQALLIAALWPEGKGNVGYGANVGSNHTSKAPDQEIWPGEGAFFGLGTNVKYPADLSKAPYSIIASGVTTLPQKVTFPFSLINAPAESIPGISPSYNEIMPAWVLSDNIFTLRRNEGKYKKRDKSRRSKFVFDVFRPDTVGLMLDARRRLREAGGKEIYTGEDIDGLGKNYMKEAARKRAVDAYTFYLRYYALTQLKKQLAAGTDAGTVLTESSSDPAWEQARKLIAEEFPGEDAKSLLRKLIEAQEKIAKDTELSKKKDDVRGARVIEDYLEAHTPAEEDGFVEETWKVTDGLREEVEGLIAKL